MATVAVTRQETGGWKVPALQFAIYNLAAYATAFLAVQGLRLAGIP